MRQTLEQLHGLLSADKVCGTICIRCQLVTTAIKSVLGWLARTVVLGCVWVIVARTHGRATWNLNQLLKVEVIDQSVG